MMGCYIALPFSGGWHRTADRGRRGVALRAATRPKVTAASTLELLPVPVTLGFQAE